MTEEEFYEWINSEAIKKDRDLVWCSSEKNIKRFNEILEAEYERVKPQKQYCRNESNGNGRCISPTHCPECRTKFE